MRGDWANDDVVIDLNAERKRRAGRRDTGLCQCSLYTRLLCRTECLRDATPAERHR